MGRAFAGILGPLAMTTVVLRALRHGAAVEGTMQWAIGSLCMFAIVGYVIGSLAEWTVEESVRSKVAAEIAAQESVAVATAESRGK